MKIVATLFLSLVLSTSVAALEYPPTQLPERMKQPETATWGSFQLRPDLTIRYVSIKPELPKRGTLVMIHGIMESPEFNYELFRHLLSLGLEVWALDLPGHGKSTRWLENSHKVYIDDFSTYTEAVHYLRTRIMHPTENTPILLMGTSLGGHIATRYVGEYPGYFDALIAQVPMYDIKTGAKPEWAVRTLAYLADSFGFSDSYVLGHGDWVLWDDYKLEKSCCTTDPERDLATVYWRIHEPELTMGGATYRWLNKAYDSMDMVNEASFLNKIKVPVLILSAGNDRLVSKEAHTNSCSLIEECEQVLFPKSKHVPTMERDEIRNRALNTIDQFIRDNSHEPRRVAAD
ncbi:alpha/beta hydrolase [Vibrio hannami]|uniref:alpha/beta hydrolase n=1 Tax=Vibrio hannami TaxID=2717094 RepID=UPI0024103DCC|nr:alpha/beta hydrolase [Vibrio hannami]MDG3085736.1 alpha/beta hydrolase [Vibrio hannami]